MTQHDLYFTHVTRPIQLSTANTDPDHRLLQILAMEPTTADLGGNGEVLDISDKSQSPQNLDIPQTEVDHSHLEEVAEAPQATITEDQGPPKASLSSKLPAINLTVGSCSVACATLHRAVPCEAPVTRSLTPLAAEPATQNGSIRPLPGTVAGSTHGNIFSVLESSQKLQTLFIMYPRLRSQLRDIYSATLPPTDDPNTLGSNNDHSYPQFQRGRGGGRGGIGRGNSSRPGPWNSDRGTQNGIDALGKAKLEFGKAGEGVREYANLVLKLVAADGVDVARLVQDEVAEENAKIIAQLLNGDA
ncbi:hypothetical protein V500_05678 [Pseudogymnoascus sp. VKM F-4518 (FW-2643)]|nr:hypothetical protein V500_05678 [Pseudogymnoascus sp. VKM F-4518 (FW-2643)]